MTNQEKMNWLQKDSINLYVSKEFFHHHAFEILKSHEITKLEFITALTSEIAITPRIKTTKGIESHAIKANDLNVVIRNLLLKKLTNKIKLEVLEENGVFYFSSKKSSIGGFDFAIINHHNNILSLRNLCYGNLQYADGENRWTEFLKKNPDLIEIANQLKQIEKKGLNVTSNLDDFENNPLIVGEIQFGNWALAYRDFFKVLKANVQNSVDCLIYIVPTGDLEVMLSDGIVTFDNSKKIIEDFAKVISVPIWLIGLDVTEIIEN